MSRKKRLLLILIIINILFVVECVVLDNILEDTQRKTIELEYSGKVTLGNVMSMELLSLDDEILINNVSDIYSDIYDYYIADIAISNISDDSMSTPYIYVYCENEDYILSYNVEYYDASYDAEYGIYNEKIPGKCNVIVRYIVAIPKLEKESIDTITFEISNYTDEENAQISTFDFGDRKE